MTRSILRGALALVAASLLGACEPCFGATACGSTAPRLVINGQIVRAADGRGVDGAHIDAVRTGGVALASDSFSVTTSGGGFWRIESAAQTAGDAELTFRVSSAALKNPYTVANRRVPTVSRGGDAAVFERWVEAPYLPFAVQLFYRGSDLPVRSTEVEFHRRGSTWLRGPAVKDSVAYSITDEGAGQATLFTGVAVADDTGAVVGDLFVHLPQPYGTSVIRDL